MQGNTRTPDDLLDEQVLDADGNQIGTVYNVWVDDSTGTLEFLSIKTAWFTGDAHIVPAENVEIGVDAVKLPFVGEMVKAAPHYEAQHDISPTEENAIYQYYGQERSIEASPSGLSQGAGGTTARRRLRRIQRGGDESLPPGMPDTESVRDRIDSPGAVTTDKETGG